MVFIHLRFDVDGKVTRYGAFNEPTIRAQPYLTSNRDNQQY